MFWVGNPIILFVAILSYLRCKLVVVVATHICFVPLVATAPASHTKYCCHTVSQLITPAPHVVTGTVHAALVVV